MDTKNTNGIHIDKRLNYIKVTLSFIQFKENDITIIYSPALDISGYGVTISEAHKSFEVALAEFMRYTLKKDTLVSELTSLGWKITGKKRNRNYIPPYFDHLLRDREYLSQIVRDKEFSKSNQLIELPA